MCASEFAQLLICANETPEIPLPPLTQKDPEATRVLALKIRLSALVYGGNFIAKIAVESCVAEEYIDIPS